MKIITEDIEEFKAVARSIAGQTKLGDVIGLTGDLGAGKTTFAQTFINTLAKKPTIVTSPTFNIVQIYDLEGKQVCHCDFYRLEDAQEIYQLGLDDIYESSITLIEWPQIAEGFLPKNTKYLNIEILENPSSRKLTSEYFI